VAAVSAPAHAVDVAAPLVTDARGTPKAVEVSSAPPAAPPPAAPTTAAHFLNELSLVQTGATHGAGSVERLGLVTAPSVSSSVPESSEALDVETLSGSISRPLSEGNGTYSVTVALHPPELGHLQAVMSLDGNELQVSLTAQTQTGHDALAGATDALKNQLARGGVNVNVTLRDPGSQSGGEDRYRPPVSAGSGPFALDAVASETVVSVGPVSSQIHLVL
jgi:flagellar hook-length control protein FliK